MQKSVIISNNIQLTATNNEGLNVYLDDGWVVVNIAIMEGCSDSYTKAIVIIEKK